jgi:hypothetical protein
MPLPYAAIAGGDRRGLVFRTRNAEDEARIQEGEDAHELTSAYCIGVLLDRGYASLAETKP